MLPESPKPFGVIGMMRRRSSFRVLLVYVVLFYGGSAERLFGQSTSSATEQASTLRGTVVNSVTHEPIGRALVFSPDNRYATLTDDRGRFEFSLPAPPLEATSDGPAIVFSGSRVRGVSSDWPTSLKARKPGFLSDSDENGGQGVPVSPDQLQLTISLDPEALVVGRVHFSSSDYLNRIQVQLYQRAIRQGREHWNNAGTMTSRADGSFRFAGLSTGSYKLVTGELLDRDPETFDPRGQLFGYPPVYYPSAADFAAAEVIHLTAGATFQADVSPIRREYFPVKVGLANVSGGIQLEVWPVGHPGPGYSLAYNAGDEEVQGSLPGGVYTISAATYGPTPMTGVLNLTVGGGPTSGANLQLLPNPSVTASLREEFEDQQTLEQLRNLNQQAGIGGRRPRYLNINLVPAEDSNNAQGASLRQPTGPEDTALVIEGVRPGGYRVEANTYLGYIAAMNSGGTDLLRKPLVVSAGAPPPIEITLRDDGAQVEGTVVDADGNGLNGAVAFGRGYNPNPVYFLPLADSEGQFRTAWIYGDGQFQMTQLPPGVYRVLAFDRQQPEIEYATEEMLRHLEPQGQVIQVSPRQKAHLKLTLIRGSK